MQCSDNKTCGLRSDEKRTFFLPLILILAGVALTALGFIGHRKPIIGNIRSEYQFNTAVVTNTLPKDEETQPPANVKPVGKPTKETKPPKQEKKAADFCPT